MNAILSIIRYPKGSPKIYEPWHHVWLSVCLTLLGCLPGLLSLPLAAASSSELDYQQLLDWYLQTPALVILNLLPGVLLIWLWYFLTGRCWLSYLLTALPVLGIAFTNYFKIQLRGDPFLAEDLKLVSEAGGIVGNYSLELNQLLIEVLLFALGGLLFALALMPRGVRRRKVRLIGAACALVVTVLSFPLVFFDQELYQETTNQEFINQWSDTQTFLSHGVVYPFLYSGQNMLPSPPEGYSAHVGEEALAQYEDQDIPQSKKVNVVGVMLEAFCDLTDFESLGEQRGVREVYEPWHELEEESVSGDLLTNIFAGGTVDSEWCFLTGYSQYEDFRAPVDSYVWYLRSQGYTTRGSHPGYAWFYNRQNINQYLGFEEYWFSENHYEELVDPVGAIWNSDHLLMEEILDDLQDQLEADNGPVFSFSVSYQNHGPYESGYTSSEVYLDPEKTGLPEETCNIFNNYLHGINITISAVTAMTDRLEEMEEPVVLVLFGDHKPWGGNGNSAYLGAGANFDLSTLDGFYEYYSTPYLIWANSAAKEVLDNDFQGDGGDFSPCFLMEELFDQCGWDGPAFMQLARDTREVTPLVHQQGIYLTRDGQLTQSLEGADLEQLEKFLYAQYYREHNIDPQQTGEES